MEDTQIQSSSEEHMLFKRNLVVLRRQEEPDSMMKSLSFCLYHSENFASFLQNISIDFFRKHSEFTKYRMKNKIEFMMVPALPEFEIINLKIQSLFLKRMIKVYFFHENFLHSDSFNDLESRKIKLYRDSSGVYQPLFSVKEVQLFTFCQNLALNLVEKAIEKNFKTFEVKDLNLGSYIIFKNAVSQKQEGESVSDKLGTLNQHQAAVADKPISNTLQMSSKNIRTFLLNEPKLAQEKVSQFHNKEEKVTEENSNYVSYFGNQEGMLSKDLFVHPQTRSPKITADIFMNESHSNKNLNEQMKQKRPISKLLDVLSAPCSDEANKKVEPDNLTSSTNSFKPKTPTNQQKPIRNPLKLNPKSDPHTVQEPGTKPYISDSMLSYSPSNQITSNNPLFHIKKEQYFIPKTQLIPPIPTPTPFDFDSKILQGRLKSFDEDKGFGFIIVETDEFRNMEVFVHRSQLEAAGLNSGYIRRIKQGETIRLQMNIVYYQSKKYDQLKMKAVNVKLIH